MKSQVDPPYNVITKKTQSRLALVHENILIILDAKEKRQGEVLVVLSLFVKFEIETRVLKTQNPAKMGL
ncbi:hypothetical protein DP73_06170 [Desulfosporosinus sp. HMP52]|nr:hypothetical protein DP73_06170 [Desulfosporosinus sp. HMP52]